MLDRSVSPRVRPRALEWLALAAVPIAAFYLVYLVVATILGVHDDDVAWRPVVMWTIAVASPLSIVAIGAAAWKLGQRDYWWADDAGITWGRWRRQHVAWADVEAMFFGLPEEMSNVGGWIARIPSAASANVVALIREWRKNAIVLRLAGHRLFVIGVIGKQFVGGAAFRAYLEARLAAKQRPQSDYTGRERHELSAHFVASKLLQM